MLPPILQRCTPAIGTGQNTTNTENTTSFCSALLNNPIDAGCYVWTFGTDSSLTVTPGWDNVTGVGTPNGAAFVNAIVP